MRVSDILAAGGVVVQPVWQTFEDAVGGLVETLVAHGQIAEDLAEPAVRAICQREEMSSTTIVEINARIPHARLAGVDGVVAALAVSTTSVYSAQAGIPISIMALVLSSPELAGEHLQLLARLSMLLQSETVRHELRHAPDSRTALAILRRQEMG